MIQIHTGLVCGWEAAVRGMRNPMNSWAKSDSFFCKNPDETCSVCESRHTEQCVDGFVVGSNDQKLMTTLRNAGTDHRKFMRMIVVYVDIVAPLYWWKEFDTYKVGTVTNSCSTMHKIHEKEFTLDDFSHEHLTSWSMQGLEYTVEDLNLWRSIYLHGGSCGKERYYEPKDKEAWWQMIQLLPSSYNQKRTVMLNYEVLANIYKSRKNHKLDEWHVFCKWIETVPLSELITGEEPAEVSD